MLDLDLGVVRQETLHVTIPVEAGGQSRLRLLEDGVDLTVYGLWPNGPRTTTTGPDGLTGQLVYLGKGEYEEFDGHRLDGAIALMEFESWDHWLRAASLGARAIVFIAPDETTYRQTLDKSTLEPVDIPRFWIGAEEGRRLRRRLMSPGEELAIRLDSRMDWRRRPAWNLWVEIPGSDSLLAAERIIVQAYYDGVAATPSLAPSAESASSAAALLEVARHLRDSPPERTVLLLFTGAHFQAMSGVVDFLDRHARTAPYYAKRMSEPLPTDLFISLDLSTKTDQIGIWNNTYDFGLKRFFVPFGRRFTRYAEEVSPDLQRDPERALVNGISPIRGMDWSTFVPDGVSVDSEVALDVGLPSLAFVTIHDARFPVNTPLDTPDRVRYEHLDSQSQFLSRLLSQAFADTALFTGLEDFRPVLKDQLRTHRVRVRSFPRRSETPDRMIPEAVVFINGGTHKGVDYGRVILTDEEGQATIPGLYIGGNAISAFGLDEETGEVIYAPDLSTRAQKFHGKPLPSGRLSWSVRWASDTKTIVVFPAVTRTLYGLTSPNTFRGLRGMKIIDSGGIAPRQLGYFFGGLSSTDLAVVYTPRQAQDDDRFLKLLVGTAQQRMLFINSAGGRDENEAKGAGYDLSANRMLPTELLALQDMWNLNDARLHMMRSHAIENQRLSRLHEAGQRLLGNAQEAMAELRWSDYIGHVRAGLGVTMRAYPEVVATLNDVISGIVFFLALVIPAAFFGERLLFAAADIRWQLAGFGVVLLVIWVLISQVHPAFDIAHPLIILLAFAIMAMAIFVLAMVSSRFNRFLKEFQAKKAKVHQTDISRISAAYAAFLLGISNMRRRRMRTGLTLLTLTLLTFTVLSFTSFRPDVRFLVFSLDHEGSYEGVLIRDRGWNGLMTVNLDYARSHFGDHGVVAPRGWYISYAQEEKRYTEVRRDTLHTQAAGLLGLTPQERQVTGFGNELVAGRWLQEGDGEVCLLPTEMAERLGIDATAIEQGAQVQIFGKQFGVIGLFEAELVESIRDLDDEPLTPADFQLSSTDALGPGAGPSMVVVEDEVLSDVRPFVHLSADNVLVMPYSTLQVVFGDLRSIGIRLNPDAPVEALIEDYLVRITGTMFAGLRDMDSISVSSYTSMGITSVEGMEALLVPMLIAALIVLNAMMGAVYERFREIAVYSSVGLAPMHIALLFIAEACVYAVIGVTLGYLFGQGLGKILVHFDLLSGLSLNYSSMAAIVSAVMVMAVVMLSTLYPARLAARSAVPDTVRRWHPQDPQGDEWVFEFPFMVGVSEIEGIAGFLASFFNAYGEESIGVLYADKVRILVEEREDGERELAVQLLLWLAPFDMGVSQFVQIDLAPSATPGVHGVFVYILRLSGQDTYWQRVNGSFFNALRKQFLLWHTMSAADKVYHRDAARRMLDAGPEAVFQAGRQEVAT
ncbi:MAG: M28 family peptidase [Gemmatimonadetes bacterium]|nr:M28 family peptidase [Gemmatimonadota bacterium]MBT7858672.1 M28 family peptidase [Gemmatimonadota bacterium]